MANHPIETRGCLWGPLFSGENPNSTTFISAKEQNNPQIQLCRQCLWTEKDGVRLGCQLFNPSSQVQPRKS